MNIHKKIEKLARAKPPSRKEALNILSKARQNSY
jgi:hypothetical protein